MRSRASSRESSLQSVANEVAKSRARRLWRVPEKVSTAKLLSIASRNGADDPENVVANALVGALTDADDDTLEAWLVREVRSRSLDEARRRSRAASRTRAYSADIAEGATASADASLEDDDAKLRRLRERTLIAAASLGLAEEYITNCKKQGPKRLIVPDPKIIAELKRYEILALEHRAHERGPFDRRTREKINRRIVETVRRYAAVIGAAATLLFWNARKASAQGAAAVLVGIGALLLLAWILLRSCGPDGRAIGAEGARTADARDTAHATRDLNEASERAERASQQCHAFSAGYELKECLLRLAATPRPDYWLSAALFRKVLAYRYDSSRLEPKDDIPGPSLGAWQDARAHRGLSKIYVLQGDDESALAHYVAQWETLFGIPTPNIKTRPLEFDCHVILMLMRRVRGPKAALEAYEWCQTADPMWTPYPSSGPHTRSHLYDLGITHALAGSRKTAVEILSSVAATAWYLQSEREYEELERHTAPSSWTHVIADDRAALADAPTMLRTLLEELGRDGDVLLDSDLAVWTMAGEGRGEYVLSILALGIPPPWPCSHSLPSEKGGTKPAIAPSLDVDTRGEAVLEYSYKPWIGQGDSYAWHGRTASGAEPIPMHFSIAARTPGEPEECPYRSRELLFCLLPDGRVASPSACHAN